MSIRARGVGVIVAGVIATTAVFLEPLEGVATRVYTDVAGVKTYCIGETQDVDESRTYSVDECRQRLIDRLPDYYYPIKHALKREVPFEMEVSLTSLSYNLGPQTIINSSPFRMINDGHLEAGCYALMAYRYAGGKDCSIPANRCQGLIKRRVTEIRKCLEGVNRISN